MDALRGSLSNAESFGRGAAVAPIGLLGDLEALLRKGVNFSFGRGGVNVNEAPVLPTTEGLLAQISRMTQPRMETAGMEQMGAAANPRGPIELAKGVGGIAGRQINKAMLGEGGFLAPITPQPMFAVSPGAKKITKADQTVMRPERMAYPDIYKNPKDLVAEAASRVAAEDPLLQRLFGVSRDDLFQIAQQGQRQGNIPDIPFRTAANPKGAAHAEQVMNPRNVDRLQSIITEAKTHPELYKGMGAWYTMDPLYDRFVQIFGADNAAGEYAKFNTLTGMASPGSEVLTELNRGTAANWLDTQGRFADFQKYGGLAGSGPKDMAGVMGHPYHSTAQSGPMGKYLESGIVDMNSAKVPSYIAASGVPDTGFQTRYPVGDAHWSRIVGLPDVRGATTKKGVESVPNASASVPEMVALGPWWESKIAKPLELESVPAQAIIWGAGSGATGVTSPIGAPKLELLAQQIGETAKRLNVSPETARDMVIQGQTHAGFVDPALAAALAAVTGGGLLGAKYYSAD